MQGEYYEGTMLAVFGHLPATIAEDVWLTGHIFEPGLMDNASGAVLCASIAEAVSQIGGELHAGKPRRGLKVFHSQECYGVLALRQFEPGRLAGGIAHLNIDMVGLSRMPVRLGRGLLASMAAPELLLRACFEKTWPKFQNLGYEYSERFGINCSILAEPAMAGIPTTLLMQDNPAWHTSADRGEFQNLDTKLLHKLITAGAAWVAFLQYAGDDEADWLLELVKARIRSDLQSSTPADLDVYLEIQRRICYSACSLASSTNVPILTKTADDFLFDLATHSSRRSISPPGSETEIRLARSIYPTTILGGTATDQNFTKDQIKKIGGPRWSRKQLILKSWADGSRNIYEIARRSIYELGFEIPLGYALSFFETYADQGIVSLETES